MATEERLVREGRLFTFPKKNWTTVTVATVDFELLFNALRTPLRNYLAAHEDFRAQYDGTTDEITEAIVSDINMFLSQALHDTWNRLRFVAETHHYPTRDNNMRRKAPSIEGFKLPRFYAAILSGIGPLVVEDSIYNTTIIYSTIQDRRDNYGRQAPPVINSDVVLRFVNRLERIHMDLSTVATRNLTGSFFTTCSLEEKEPNSYTLYGLLNQKYYTQQDVAMALPFSTVGTNTHPFEDVGLTIGFVNIDAVTDAIEALPLPAAPNQPAADVTRPVLGTINVAYSGVAPAANHPVTERGRGIYIFGRGYDRLGCFSLARGLRLTDINAIIRDRLVAERKKNDWGLFLQCTLIYFKSQGKHFTYSNQTSIVILI